MHPNNCTAITIELNSSSRSNALINLDRENKGRRKGQIRLSALNMVINTKFLSRDTILSPTTII